MHANRRRLLKVLDNWPGRKKFGHFSFLPVFFVVGAGLEFVMIKWTVGQTNFYDTFKRRKAVEAVDEKLRKLKLKEKIQTTN